MARREPTLRIHDMLEAIAGIEATIAGKTQHEVASSWVLRSAIERGVEVISEASRYLPEQMKADHPQVRWKDIAGIGNILRHEYQRAEPTILWRVAVAHLPQLKAALLAMRAEAKE